jgi:hypothetical protein
MFKKLLIKLGLMEDPQIFIKKLLEETAPVERVKVVKKKAAKKAPVKKKAAAKKAVKKAK